MSKVRTNRKRNKVRVNHKYTSRRRNGRTRRKYKKKTRRKTKLTKRNYKRKTYTNKKGGWWERGARRISFDRSGMDKWITKVKSAQLLPRIDNTVRINSLRNFFHVLIGLREIAGTFTGESTPFMVSGQNKGESDNKNWLSPMTGLRGGVSPTINDNERPSYSFKKHYDFFPPSMRELVRLFDITADPPSRRAKNKRYNKSQRGGGWKPSYVSSATSDQLATILNHQINIVCMEHFPSLAEKPSGYDTPYQIVTAEEWSQRLGGRGQKWFGRAAQKKNGVIIFGSHKNFALLLDFDKYLDARPHAKVLAIDNNAVLIFERVIPEDKGGPAMSKAAKRLQPEKVKLKIINDDDESARKIDQYDYINSGTAFHATVLENLGCFQGIKKLFEGNDLNYIILVRHGVSLHSVLKSRGKAEHKYEVRNSKLLPKQMVVKGPIFKQAYALHKHLKSENVELIYCCSDLIRTQQSLVTFRCAYEWIMKLSNVVLTPPGHNLLRLAKEHRRAASTAADAAAAAAAAAAAERAAEMDPAEIVAAAAAAATAAATAEKTAAAAKKAAEKDAAATAAAAPASAPAASAADDAASAAAAADAAEAASAAAAAATAAATAEKAAAAATAAATAEKAAATAEKAAYAAAAAATAAAAADAAYAAADAATPLSNSLYYKALLDCLKTSMIPELRSIYGESKDARLLVQERLIRMLGHGNEDLTHEGKQHLIEELLYLVPPVMVPPNTINKKAEKVAQELHHRPPPVRHPPPVAIAKNVTTADAVRTTHTVIFDLEELQKLPNPDPDFQKKLSEIKKWTVNHLKNDDDPIPQNLGKIVKIYNRLATNDDQIRHWKVDKNSTSNVHDSAPPGVDGNEPIDLRQTVAEF